jgi:hypothetical protein
MHPTAQPSLMGQQTAKYAIQDFKFLKADADQETVVFLTK